MRRAILWNPVLMMALAIPCLTAQARTPAEVFARLSEMSGVRISPDGRYLSFLSRVDGTLAVKVLDRETGRTRPVLTSTENRFDVTYCRWANNTRLLCGYRGTDNNGIGYYTVTRLVAVDADGKNMKVLVQNSWQGASQFQDSILDITPDEPDTVLVEVDDDRDTFPSVFELNIYTGILRIRARQHDPIYDFMTDTHDVVRLGCGMRGTNRSCYARSSGEDPWKELLKYEAFQQDQDVLWPLAFSADPNKVYARGPYEGRAALWEVDLTDATAPKLVFSHPGVDVGLPNVLEDGTLRGVRYDTDRPFIYYTDPFSDEIMRAVRKVLPDTFTEIVDETRDRKLLVLRSYSDVEPGRYYLLKVESMRLKPLGDGDSGLNTATLGRMQSISYPARDGTAIPGYLTVPRGVTPTALPLIVMPHGGPINRDYWRYSALLQFLVDRGYAVLQMNFRGSSGYGEDWYWAAHQDWGGLTYTDVVDGARWAIQKGLADPQRVCIVGWSFGGYVALLGATRNNDLFRCSVSIAGVSDLTALEWQARYSVGNAMVKRQIGTDKDKLREDSPALHAKDVAIPVLLVHGTKDSRVPADQSRQMAAALKRADKPYELVLIQDAEHALNREPDMLAMLTALDRFLEANLGPGVTPPPQ